MTFDQILIKQFSCFTVVFRPKDTDWHRKLNFEYIYSALFFSLFSLKKCLLVVCLQISMHKSWQNILKLLARYIWFGNIKLYNGQPCFVTFSQSILFPQRLLYSHYTMISQNVFRLKLVMFLIFIKFELYLHILIKKHNNELYNGCLAVL